MPFILTHLRIDHLLCRQDKRPGGKMGTASVRGSDARLGDEAADLVEQRQALFLERLGIIVRRNSTPASMR